MAMSSFQSWQTREISALAAEFDRAEVFWFGTGTIRADIGGGALGRRRWRGDGSQHGPLQEVLWSRQLRRRKHCQRRERKAHFEELVQVKGSFHAWFEERGPRGCLMDMVDDA
jgi:hypothetical protein